eukprot:CAMPEP_0116068984 /NCGR_PEP_ID=MMETSP0322-20121206/11997_1 /TAXON_ID=163516 /ORGANISM="Leptocylindrus danicus var. apora, Strain B651" /LENGTH=446 /DNA_ID=CAMNT_0003556221 /DNA_START=179 /DNA_END=1519 /DNA_ORIENTATION=-
MSFLLCLVSTALIVPAKVTSASFVLTLADYHHPYNYNHHHRSHWNYKNSNIPLSVSSSFYDENDNSDDHNNNNNMIAVTNRLYDASRSLLDKSSSNSNFDFLSSSTTSQQIQMESEILSDVAHVGLDVMAILSPNDKELLRVASLIGRVAAIASDYLPDHSMTRDEVMFQGLMLCICIGCFVEAAFPAFSAAAIIRVLNWIQCNRNGNVNHNCNDGTLPSSSSWKNVYAWTYLFQPNGVNAFQFYTLSNIGALDWIDVKPQDRVVNCVDDGGEDNNYLYWMYRGSIELSWDQGVSYVPYLEQNERLGNKNVNGGNGDHFTLVADMEYLCQLDRYKLHSRGKHKRSWLDDRSFDDTCDLPTTKGYEVEPSSCNLARRMKNSKYSVEIRAGTNGARLMRLDKRKLWSYMMNSDESTVSERELVDAIQALLVKGMQKMLEALMNSNEQV